MQPHSALPAEAPPVAAPSKSPAQSQHGDGPPMPGLRGDLSERLRRLKNRSSSAVASQAAALLSQSSQAAPEQQPPAAPLSQPPQVPLWPLPASQPVCIQPERVQVCRLPQPMSRSTCRTRNLWLLPPAAPCPPSSRGPRISPCTSWSPRSCCACAVRRASSLQPSRPHRSLRSLTGSTGSVAAGPASPRPVSELCSSSSCRSSQAQAACSLCSVPALHTCLHVLLLHSPPPPHTPQQSDLEHSTGCLAPSAVKLNPQSQLSSPRR